VAHWIAWKISSLYFPRSALREGARWIEREMKKPKKKEKQVSVEFFRIRSPRGRLGRGGHGGKGSRETLYPEGERRFPPDRTDRHWKKSDSLVECASKKKKGGVFDFGGGLGFLGVTQMSRAAPNWGECQSGTERGDAQKHKDLKNRPKKYFSREKAW